MCRVLEIIIEHLDLSLDVVVTRLNSLRMVPVIPIVEKPHLRDKNCLRMFYVVHQVERKLNTNVSCGRSCSRRTPQASNRRVCNLISHQLIFKLGIGYYNEKRQCR